MAASDFKTIETRISYNKKTERWRVAFKKGGKPNAKIFKSIDEARAFRDETSADGAKPRKNGQVKPTKAKKSRPTITEIETSTISGLSKTIIIVTSDSSVVDRILSQF